MTEGSGEGRGLNRTPRPPAPNHLPNADWRGGEERACLDKEPSVRKGRGFVLSPCQSKVRSQLSRDDSARAHFPRPFLFSPLEISRGRAQVDSREKQSLSRETWRVPPLAAEPFRFGK